MTPEQHFTQPPPRYTEATLVKRMEELGIGRPSTYASIVSTIQEREYVRKEKNRLLPEDKGRLVTAFLANYFGRYVDYDFTADLEEDLDRVTTGDEDWKALLGRFWKDFSAALGETEGLRITEVMEKINEVLEPHLFPKTPEDPEPRRCKVCGSGLLSLEDLAQRLGLHRLLQLSRMPLHPPARRRRRGRRRTRRQASRHGHSG